jgi:hypothetical protein
MPAMAKQRMNGWELGDAYNHLNKKGIPRIKEFIAAYGPLAALSDAGATLLIVRRYHPTMNVSADNKDYVSDDFAVGLAYFSTGSYTWFYLPKSYTYQRVTVDGTGSRAVVTIKTKERGAVTTNFQELFRHLANISGGEKASDEKRILKGFAALCNQYDEPAPPIRITQKTIRLQSVGVMKRGSFDDWWTRRFVFPYFEKSLPVTIAGYNPQDPHDAWILPAADKAIAAFVGLGTAARMKASSKVLRNCHDYLEMVETGEWSQGMENIKDAKQIWLFVKPRTIHVQTHKKRVYVSVLCECDWEEEHGLQLVYRNGRTLTRVSEQDGHV